MADVKISALPVSGTIVPSTNVLPVVNGGLTTKATVSTLVNAALPTVTANIVPTVDNTYSLGTLTNRWNGVFVGPGSLWIQDTNNAGLNVELTVTDGVLLLNGATTLGVGNLTLTDPVGGNPTIQAINRNALYLFGESVTIEDNAGGGRLTCSSEGVAINSDATNVTVSNGKIAIAGMNVPRHSYGDPGDTVGLVAFDSGYIYYCTANYVNNSTTIWKRVAWDNRTW